MKSYDPFEGVINRTQAESTPWWPTPAHPGGDAPDVVLILLDDTGFSHFGCYGSELVTPTIDRLASGGLRYTNFHVTPLCSPTRASLLTGRNHHTVGMRSISNFDSGYPHMSGHITNHATTVAEVLRDEGYATFALGKWHLCSMENTSAAGPYDQWPCQRGFDRYYGFLEGETDQFYPELVYDNHMVEPPSTPDEGYHLSEDLVDHAIGFIHDTVSIRPDRPFFSYLAFGAMHAPHQAPAAYLAKYRGRFDDGWDVARDTWFARQMEMGLFPAGTQPAPRNPGVEAWDTLPENQRRLAARLQEAFAAFLEHTDAQIGRLVAALETLGRLDNTLFILLSDNGASQEGGPFGVMHEMKYFNFMIETPDEAVERIDDIGGPHSHSNYPWGWAQAGNTPFKWYKQNTHEGGVHVPLIVHWPDHITDKGALRDQFHHVDDVVPTIYETLGVEAPATYRGLEQIPLSGVSMRYSFDAPDDAQPQSGAVLRDDGPQGHLHRGMEGGDPTPARHALRGRRLGALPPGRGPLRMPQPGRGDARQGGRDGRAVVARGRGVRRAAARRPDHRAVRHPVPRPLAPSLEPPLHLLPPDVTAARAGRPGPRGTRLGHVRHHRAPRRRRRRALRLGNRKLRGQPVHPERPPGLRLQLLRGPPRDGVGGGGPGRRGGSGRTIPPVGEERRGHPGHRR